MLKIKLMQLSIINKDLSYFDVSLKKFLKSMKKTIESENTINCANASFSNK